MSVNIHGKEYVTVAERVIMAHNLEKVSIETEPVRFSDKGILFKATVTTEKGIFTGHAYSSLSAQGIEGSSPIEVAETSAIGRALGFAGYGGVSGATADEVVKSESGLSKPSNDFDHCEVCNTALTVKVADFSKEKYGKLLCFNHQKTATQEEGE